MAVMIVQGKVNISSNMLAVTVQTDSITFIIDDPGPGDWVQIHCNGTYFITDFAGADTLRGTMR